MIPSRSEHYPALDGIRGIAILAVMVFHFFSFGGMVTGGILDRVSAAIASTGWVGVDLFFVLSGFLITGVLSDARGSSHFLRHFYTRRALRIFPLYYAVLVVFFVVLPQLLPSSQVVHANTQGQLWFWTYLSNVQITVYGWHATSLYVDHFWSLAIEEQFYLVWPLLVLFLSRRAMLYTCGVVVVASLVLRLWLHVHSFPTAAYVLTAARMDTLAIGAALALAIRDPAQLLTLLRWVRPVLATAILLLAGICVARGGLDKNDPVVGTVGFSLLGLTFGGILLLGITAPTATSPFARLFVTAPLRALGKYSYALYVFHQPVALMLVGLGFSAAIIPPIAGLGLPGEIVYAAFAGAISLIAAMLSWHLYEKHFLKLKDRFSHRQTDSQPRLTRKLDSIQPAKRGAELAAR